MTYQIKQKNKKIRERANIWPSPDWPSGCISTPLKSGLDCGNRDVFEISKVKSAYIPFMLSSWKNIYQHLPKGAVWTLGDAGWCCIGTPNIIDLAPLGRSRYDMCFVFPSGTVFSSEPATYLHIRYLYWSCLRFSSISKNYQLVSTQHVQPLTSCFVPP